MRPRLALLLLLTLATIYPVPSCRYKTYAQEPGDIVAVDSNAGIMTLAAGDIAYPTLQDFLVGLNRSSQTFWSFEDYEPIFKTFILKDIQDDETGFDAMYFSGALCAYTTGKNASTASWKSFIYHGEIYRLANGNYAVKLQPKNCGLPYVATSGISNIYNITYEEAAKYCDEYVAYYVALAEKQETTFNASGQYDKVINYTVTDSDGGGVSDLAEWVRGTATNDFWDDSPSSDPLCTCGACCSCECECGLWHGAQCSGKGGEGGCDCHVIECVCSTYCCECECKCEAHEVGETHGAHKNGERACLGLPGDCDCHPESDCTCAYYCCLDKCECEAHGDGSGHGKHKNGLTYCNEGNDPDAGGCDCHGSGEDPEDPENPESDCTCADYCCLDKCACEAHGDGSGHGKHKNGLTYCNQGSDSSAGGCSCHGSELPDCTCADYCCRDKCACGAHADGSPHTLHQNGSSTCLGEPGENGCDCHIVCTCANYCCKCACECAYPKCSNGLCGVHKNGSTQCSGGESDCECHRPPDFDVPEVERSNEFISKSEYEEWHETLRKKLDEKFNISFVRDGLENFQGSTTLPVWKLPTESLTGEPVEINLNIIANYEIFAIARSVLALWVYFFTFSIVFNSLRKLL